MAMAVKEAREIQQTVVLRSSSFRNTRSPAKNSQLSVQRTLKVPSLVVVCSGPRHDPGYRLAALLCMAIAFVPLHSWPPHFDDRSPEGDSDSEMRIDL